MNGMRESLHLGRGWRLDVDVVVSNGTNGTDDDDVDWDDMAVHHVFFFQHTLEWLGGLCCCLNVVMHALCVVTCWQATL